MPKSTQEALFCSSQRGTIWDWLQRRVEVVVMNVYEYAIHLKNSLDNRKLAVAFVHFLYHSLLKDHLSSVEIDCLCNTMPLIDNYGNLTTKRQGVLVPSNGSKWVELIFSNLWRGEDYIELGEEYLRPGYFAGEFTPGEQLLEFLKTRVGASDIPCISPPNAEIPSVSAPLTNQNAFLLLEWIQNLKYRGIRIPNRFLKSIKDGNWMKITTIGCPGYQPPSRSFMLNSSLETILQNGSVLVDIPLIDQNFYGDRIHDYEEELKTIGVMFECGEACEYIGNHLMSLADYSTLTRGQVLSVLNFIRYLRENSLPLDKFISRIKERRWLRTSCGGRSPVESALYDPEWRIASQISDIPFIDRDYFGEEILSFKEELKSLGVLTGFGGNFKLVEENLKSSSRLTALTAEGILLILECMQHLESTTKLIATLRGVKCFKTNMGYKSPEECFLFDSHWACMLQVFNGFPLIDHGCYGSNIFFYKNELRQMGVKVDFEEAVKVFARRFQQQASSMTKENVLSFLSCYREIEGTPRKFPADFKKLLREEKWLRTRLGGVYRTPSNCILYGPNWKSIASITVLPFIDDSENSYGMVIHEYEKELKKIGVVTEVKDGVKFVADNLCFPQDPSRITSANVLALLECISILLNENRNYTFPDTFMKRISQKWLKTYDGYRLPDECCLFDSSWGSYLKHTDGPFVDEGFYGSYITSYKKELDAIGVTVHVYRGCPLIASHLNDHHEFSTIVRIYNYLNAFTWAPHSEAVERIWIPDACENGEWVRPQECVLHDEDDLFSSRLHVLDKYYDPELLIFFSRAFQVKGNPSVDDYCKLWKDWESSGHRISHADGCNFWVYVSKHWDEETAKIVSERFVKLPVGTDSDGILLSDRHDVFIADDLQLKNLFERTFPQPIFVWYPQRSLSLLPRTKLLEIYRKIGVRTISESVKKEDASLVDVAQLNQVDPKETLIKKGLVRLLFCFLADPVLNMEVGSRHEAIQGLLNANFLETVEPITVNYSLKLSSGEIVKLTESRMIRWDRTASKFFAQKLDRSNGKKNILEYATYFAESISEGLIWNNGDRIGALSELIKLGFVLDFEEESVEFLMRSRNLQIFAEDEEFLTSAFPSDHVICHE